LNHKLGGWISQARQEPSFTEIRDRFAQAGIRNWLQEDEKLLLFSIGAYAPGQGAIVEIGSFEGGSAAFLAAGIGTRGEGQLYCIDPHLGGPPWLGMAPAQSTLEIFREKVKYCGVDRWIISKVGDSAAVAAIWPAEPIDAFFIDGDHSFRGALKDLESWLPKLRAGGHVLIDDADDPTLMELLEFIRLVKTLSSLKYLDTVQGIAVFERRPGTPWDALKELGEVCSKRGISRPWDYSPLHKLALPDNYLRSRSWPDDPGLNVAYQFCFLARCGPGAYGYSLRSLKTDREILRSVSRDKKDGEVIEVGKKGPAKNLRAVLCSPEEARDLAPLLMPGGVLISREEKADSITTRGLLIQAGLEGCGFGNGLQWGVWQPGYISADAVIDYAIRAYRES
jgi:predicted O-methyltransferase YrrM